MTKIQSYRDTLFFSLNYMDINYQEFSYSNDFFILHIKILPIKNIL